MESGITRLMPESEIWRKVDSKILVAGIFAIHHSLEEDRLIVDWRLASSCEKRSRHAGLPQEPMLVLLILEDDQETRGSGDDLSNFCYNLAADNKILRGRAFAPNMRGKK